MQFKERPYASPVSTRDVTNPHPAADTLEAGDEAVLYLDAASHRQIAIYVRVTSIKASGQCEGEVSRANRPGARGEPRLAKGALLDFRERNVFHYVKEPS